MIFKKEKKKKKSKIQKGDRSQFSKERNEKKIVLNKKFHQGLKTFRYQIFYL